MSVVNTGLENDQHIQLWQSIREPPRFYGETTNQATYRKWELPGRDNSADARTVIDLNRDVHTRRAHGVPFVGVSTTQATYIAYEQESTTNKPRMERDLDTRNPARFYGITTNSETYVPFDPEEYNNAKAARSERIEPRTSVPFYGESTSAGAYRAPDVDRTAALANAERARIVYDENKAYFYGTTTNQEFFQEWDVHANHTQPFRPSSQNALRDLPFYGETTSRAAFVQHPLPKTKTERLRNRGQNGTHQPGLRFHGISETQEQFRAFETQERSEADPNATACLGKAPPSSQTRIPFVGVSTSKQAFQGWQLPRQGATLSLETVDDGIQVMVPKNTTIPARVSKTFTTVTDNQSSVKVTVLQGEGNKASELEPLGSFELVGIPAARCAVPQIEVSFTINEQGILHIDAKDKQTGKAHHIAIDKVANRSAFSGAL